MKTIPHTLRPHTAALLLITCCILLLISCERDPYRHGEPDLPPITMEGKNTLGFLLNGKVWVPYQDKPGIFTPTLEAWIDGKHLRISARLKRSGQTQYQAFSVTIYPIDIGIHRITGSGYVFTDQFKVGLGCNYFKCKPEGTEIDIIHFDETKRIVSGTFYFKNAINECGDTLQITEGRFDVRY